MKQKLNSTNKYKNKKYHSEKLAGIIGSVNLPDNFCEEKELTLYFESKHFIKK